MDEHFNMDYLNTFVIAAETGKLNVTADIVYRSHSAVSTQIRKLEEQVGNILFIRNKESLILTKSGEVLLKYAKNILDLNTAAFKSLNNNSWKGDISFGVPTDYSELFVTSIYPNLQKELPNFLFTTICSRSREIRKQIDEGKINMGIVAMEPQYSDDLLLWEESLNWVCSKNFKYSNNEPIPVALFSDNCIINNHSLYCLKKSNKEYKIIFTSSTLNNILDSVKAGIAISLLPESLIIDDLNYVSKKILNCPFTLKIGCTWGEDADPGVLESILKSIKEGISDIKKNRG